MTDITHIRTMEGFAYLAVVLDLYSRRVVGWSLQSRQTTECGFAGPAHGGLAA